MEITVNLQFEQVLHAVKRLPKSELRRLIHALQHQLDEEQPATDWQQLLQKAPTWSDAEVEKVEEARQHFNQLGGS